MKEDKSNKLININYLVENPDGFTTAERSLFNSKNIKIIKDAIIGNVGSEDFVVTGNINDNSDSGTGGSLNERLDGIDSEKLDKDIITKGENTRTVDLGDVKVYEKAHKQGSQRGLYNGVIDSEDNEHLVYGVDAIEKQLKVYTDININGWGKLKESFVNRSEFVEGNNQIFTAQAVQEMIKPLEDSILTDKGEIVSTDVISTSDITTLIKGDITQQFNNTEYAEIVQELDATLVDRHVEGRGNLYFDFELAYTVSESGTLYVETIHYDDDEVTNVIEIPYEFVPETDEDGNITYDNIKVNGKLSTTFSVARTAFGVRSDGSTTDIVNTIIDENVGADKIAFKDGVEVESVNWSDKADKTFNKTLTTDEGETEVTKLYSENFGYVERDPGVSYITSTNINNKFGGYGTIAEATNDDIAKHDGTYIHRSIIRYTDDTPTKWVTLITIQKDGTITGPWTNAIKSLKAEVKSLRSELKSLKEVK